MTDHRKRLPSHDVARIRELYDAGAYPSELAARFNKSRSVISRIINGHTYRHVRPERAELLAEVART